MVGIIDGSLGILAGIIGFAGVSALQSLGETLRVGNSIGLAITLGYIQAAGTLITAVALLIGGITFLRGNRYNVLLYAAFAQVALVLLNMVYSLMASSASTSYNGSWIIGVAIGLGLAGSIIYLLFKPESKSWRKSVRPAPLSLGIVGRTGNSGAANAIDSRRPTKPRCRGPG